MASDTPQMRAASPVLAIAVAGGSGALLLVVLAVTGAADAGPAIVGAGLAAALTAVLALSVRRRRAWEEMLASSGEAEGQPPFALVLEELPDPVMLLSVGGSEIAPPRYVFANAAARELFRIARPEGLLASAVRNPVVLETVAEALAGGAERRAVLEPAAGQERVWQVVARPLEDPDGDRRLGLLWLRDETDTRRAERMRADFLANASHELRTPLASLTGFIETLRGHAREDEAARERFLGIMAAQADRMARLIGDLLSLSRIELNEHIAPSGAVDLDQAVRDVLDAMGPLTRSGGPRIETRLAGERAATVTGDRDQIIQVAQNLVDNAVKYAGPHGVVTVETLADVGIEALTAMRRADGSRLTLLAPEHAPGERFALVSVTDSGPGIARENLPRLTERFYRVEGQKSGERSGTGLGLAIVKHIVNRHKGALGVESAAGEGTTFTALFPMAERAAS